MSKNTIHIETLAGFLARQMDGEQVPPVGGPDFQKIAAAVRAMTTAPDEDLSTFGARALGAVIDRVRASIGAQKALFDFIQPGGPA